MTQRLTHQRLTLTLAAGPIVLALLLVVFYVVTEQAGMRLLTDRALNPAELVIEDDPPGLIRRLRAGDSPVATYDVGSDVLARSARRMTPMEAAAYRDRGSMLDLLVREGVPDDDAMRAHLLCIAERMGSRDVIAMLSRPGVTAVCGPRADAVAPLPAGAGR
ncbi:MAG: hypothetical protein ABL971_01175 [Vicinamibacterales bacterium]